MPKGGRLAQVELRGVSKRYPGGVEAVAAVDLTIADGALFVIVGPSGSGKSTLLRLIAGLETPDAGSVWIDGRRADGLAPRDRDVAMVFQHPVLYPHLSVFENLAFSLRARKVGRAELERRVTAVAEDLGLLDVLGRPATALSGGQRQRVALGRAIVRQPRMFLFDEPLSGLDPPLRASARADLMGLHRRFPTTTLHVTHDQDEAMAMGDRVAVMERGRIVQEGTPREIYDHPRHRFVAEFMGSPPMNFLTCQRRPRRGEDPGPDRGNRARGVVVGPGVIAGGRPDPGSTAGEGRVGAEARAYPHHGGRGRERPRRHHRPVDPAGDLRRGAPTRNAGARDDRDPGGGALRMATSGPRFEGVRGKGNGSRSASIPRRGPGSTRTGAALPETRRVVMGLEMATLASGRSGSRLRSREPLTRPPGTLSRRERSRIRVARSRPQTPAWRWIARGWPRG